MKLGIFINQLQQAETELGSDAEVVALIGDWWDCRSRDKEWPVVTEVVPINYLKEEGGTERLKQVGISHSPLDPT